MGQKLPQVWYIFLKRVVPHLILLVFCKRVLMVQGNDAFAFGRYGSYPTAPYQIVGLVIFGGIIALFLVGLVYPAAYSIIVPPPTSIFINRRDTMEDDLEDHTGDESESEASAPAIEELAGMEDPEDIMDNVQRVDLN